MADHSVRVMRYQAVLKQSATKMLSFALPRPFFRFLIFFCLVRLVPGCNIRLDEEVTLPPLLICALKVFL